MKIKMIGSGGCVSIPKPLCQCTVCTQAREKGVPYARCGCSLYVEDIGLLIDTPEDIVYALNYADVKTVDYILYSHIDPDHTMGMRVIEQLRLNWLNCSIGIKCTDPITVVSLPEIIKDLKLQGTKYGSALDYYESMNLINIQASASLSIHSVQIDMIPVDDSAGVTIFVFTEGLHKVIYAPCDVKPFPEQDIFMDADCMMIGNTIVGDILKDGFILKKDNPLRDELFVLDEVIELKNKYRIKRVIITHLEEDWGKSYDDYRKLEEQLDGIEFAYDGLELNFGDSIEK